MPPDLRPEVLDDFDGVLLRKLGDDVLKEASDGVFRHVARLHDLARLDDRLGRRVELENRIHGSFMRAVAHSPASPRASARDSSDGPAARRQPTQYGACKVWHTTRQCEGCRRLWGSQATRRGGA